MVTPIKAIVLFSGGLDSILAVKLLQEQGIEPIAYTFQTPFFGPESAIQANKYLDIPIKIWEITDIYMEMLKKPKYGYGKNMNPCIDCHGLMFRLAGQKMIETGVHFLASGEVLGERPFSQNKGALNAVANLSQYPEYILRPLSAKLLPETLAEKSGWVDRRLLLDIQGRSRKRQMALAKKYGIAKYPKPAGGCRLTEPNFSKRLKELFIHTPNPSLSDLELLKVGRHLRWKEGSKVIVGRRREENDKIEALAQTGDLLLWVKDIPGPNVLIPSPSQPVEALLKFAAGAAIRYSDAPACQKIDVIYTDGKEQGQITTEACREEEIQEFLL